MFHPACCPPRCRTPTRCICGARLTAKCGTDLREHAMHYDEKVGIAKIRIHQERAHVTAVLGSFVSADKLLRSWATGPQDYFECDFEIEYLDGYRVSGRYPMWQKCTTRQSLGAY